MDIVLTRVKTHHPDFRIAKYYVETNNKNGWIDTYHSVHLMNMTVVKMTLLRRRAGILREILE